VGAAFALLSPATTFAHGVHPVGTTVAAPAGAWIVGVIPAALGLFVVILGGAMALRVVAHRRRGPVSARTQALFTSSMAVCALVALVAVVATQFIPAFQTP